MPTLFATSPFAATRSAPTTTRSTSPRAISAPALESATTRCGIPACSQLPRGQARALQQRTRLVHPDLSEPAALPGGAQHAAGGAVAAGGERAGVAVRERAVAGREQLGAELPPGARSASSCSACSSRASASASCAASTARVPRRGSPPWAARSGAAPRRPRGPRRAPCRMRRRGRSPARRARPACGCVRHLLGRLAAQPALLGGQPPLVEHEQGVVLPAKGFAHPGSDATRRARTVRGGPGPPRTGSSDCSGYWTRPDSDRYSPATCSGVFLSRSTRAFSSDITSSVRPFWTW